MLFKVIMNLLFSGFIQLNLTPCQRAKGMTTREIVAAFKEMYDADVSATLISKVTDARATFRRNRNAPVVFQSTS